MAWFFLRRPPYKWLHLLFHFYSSTSSWVVKCHICCVSTWMCDRLSIASCCRSMHEPCVGLQYFRLRPACLRLINLVQFSFICSLLDLKTTLTLVNFHFLLRWFNSQIISMRNRLWMHTLEPYNWYIIISYFSDQAPRSLLLWEEEKNYACMFLASVHSYMLQRFSNCACNLRISPSAFPILLTKL